MKKLLMISHNTHSFLLNEVEYASKTFSEVHVIALYNPELREKFSGVNNVKLHFFTKSDLKKESLRHIYTIFSTEYRNEIAATIKEKLLDRAYIKKLLFYMGLEYYCTNVCWELGVFSHGEEWKILSCWFESDAYVAYRLKAHCPDLKIYSLCHSYEVDPVKSKYITRLFRAKYHNEFEEISFISLNVRNDYENNVVEKLSLRKDNIRVCYLGTQKYVSGLSERNDHSPWHIITCSNVTPIKRVGEIFSCLNSYADIPIVWTHFGEGKDYMGLAEDVKTKSNAKLTVKLVGSVQNKSIHRFYIENKVDLFVNYSTSEGIPVSIMEAIAYGIPVVASDAGGNNEIVRPEFGRIIPIDSSLEGLWLAIKDMLLMDQSIKTTQMQKATVWFEQKFNASKIRPAYYEKILRG